ncbi:hypothetical protein H0H92_005115 [Tricholoma furcatifolium]|nr:hypothetical protein H0H92_005115 [Tricholoma furcatifolium]
MPALRLDKAVYSYKGSLKAAPHIKKMPVAEKVLNVNIKPSKTTKAEMIYYPSSETERNVYRTPGGKAVTSHQWDVYDFVYNIPIGHVTTYKDVCTAVGGSPRSDNPLIWNTVNIHSRLGTPLEHSPDKGTSGQRVSFESDRGSIPTPQNSRQGFSRTARASDPIISSAQRSPAFRDSQKDPESLTPTSHSPPHSRAASPLRLFQQWSAGLHRSRHHNDDAFVPVNPYKFQIHLKFPRFSNGSVTHGNQIHTHTHVGAESPDTAGCPACIPQPDFREYWKNTRIFLGDTVPRELYLNILLRLPSMYFSRVARIFQDAEVSKPDIQRMIESGGGYGGGNPFFGPEHITVESTPNVGRTEYPPSSASPGHAMAGLPHTMAAGIGMTTHVGTAATGSQLPLPLPDEWSPPLVSPALVRFKNSWEAFIDSLLREWKTLNLVSALLLSKHGKQKPLSGGTPGCYWLCRRSGCHASIMSFVWRTGSVSDPGDRPPLGPRGALAARIVVTGVFALGILYFLLIVRTLQSYGFTARDATWPRRDTISTSPGIRARDVNPLEMRGREQERGASLSGRRDLTPEADNGRAKESRRQSKKTAPAYNIYGALHSSDSGRVGQPEEATWLGTTGWDGQSNKFHVVPGNLPFWTKTSDEKSTKIRFYVQGVTDRGSVLEWAKCVFVDADLSSL